MLVRADTVARQTHSEQWLSRPCERLKDYQNPQDFARLRSGTLCGILLRTMSKWGKDGKLEMTCNADIQSANRVRKVGISSPFLLILLFMWNFAFLGAHASSSSSTSEAPEFGIDKSCEPNPQQPPIFALITYVDKYNQETAPVSNATGSTDAETITNVLCRHGNLSLKHSKILKNPKKRDVEKWLIELGRLVQDNQEMNPIALFYFSGVGSRISDANGDEKWGYDRTLLFSDSDVRTEREMLSTTLIDDKFENTIIEHFPSDTNLVVILDTDHSDFSKYHVKGPVNFALGEIKERLSVPNLSETYLNTTKFPCAVSWQPPLMTPSLFGRLLVDCLHWRWRRLPIETTDLTTLSL